MSVPDLNIADIRKDYRMAALDETQIGNDPLAFFGKWFTEAEAAQITDVNAMTLVTVDATHNPHARIVLLKGLDDKGFLFYTNYNSAKGQDIDANHHTALVFFWKEVERQVRVEGIAEKLSAKESNTYFISRPAGSRLSAWASPQSQVIATRDILEHNYQQYQQQFNNNIPRPEYWGGYRIIPNKIEFWQGRSNRLHDRILFERIENNWHKCRLAP